MKLSAFPYYLQSAAALIHGVRNKKLLVELFLGIPVQKPFQVELTDGMLFYANTRMDIWILKETVLDHIYEKTGTSLQQNWTVVDIGAALGDFAVWAARQMPQGRVIAVEPHPASVSLIQQNLRVNLVNNCTVIEAAVTATDGETSLQMLTGEAVQHSTAAGANGKAEIKVKTFSLSTLFTTNQVNQCDLLKLDCEGGEYEILFNLGDATLRKIQRIVMEVHDRITVHSRADMIRFLEDHGYHTRMAPNPVHDHLAYLYAER